MNAADGAVKSVARLLVVMVLIALAGCLAFAAVERVSIGRALYFTLATLSTVGYGDIVPRTSAGRWVAITLMVGGVGAAIYVFGVIFSFIVEGRLLGLLGVRRMKKAIERMEGHYIVCGYGRLGRVVGEQLAAADVDFVVIERDPAKAAAARERGLSVVEGDATEDGVLASAGVARAAGLATTTADDAENLYVALAARASNPALPVVSRSSSERARGFFRRAGLERTVSTDELGARRLVAHLTQPQVVEFLDEITHAEQGRQSLHTLRLVEGGPLAGRTISDCNLRHDFGIVVLAIHRAGAFLPNPGGEEPLRAGDILLVIGLPEQIERLRRPVAECGP